MNRGWGGCLWLPACWTMAKDSDGIMGEQQLHSGIDSRAFFVLVHALGMAHHSSGPPSTVSFPLCWLCQQENCEGAAGLVPSCVLGSPAPWRAASTEQPCCWGGGQELGQPVPWQGPPIL